MTNSNNQNVPTSGTANSGLLVPQSHKMVGDDMKLPIFNGNGLEYLEKHWFLCE